MRTDTSETDEALVCAKIGAVIFGFALAFSILGGISISLLATGRHRVLSALAFAPIAPGFLLGAAVAQPGIDDLRGFVAAAVIGSIVDFVMYMLLVLAWRHARAHRSRLGPRP